MTTKVKNSTGAAPMDAAETRNNNQPTRPLRAEWLRVRTACALYGVSRSLLYKRMETREITSISLRERGAVRGIRLVNHDSLVAFIEGAGVCLKAAATVSPVTGTTGKAATPHTAAALKALVDKLQAAAVAGQPLPPGLNLETARAALREAQEAAGEPAAGEDAPAQVEAPECAATSDGEPENGVTRNVTSVTPKALRKALPVTKAAGEEETRRIVWKGKIVAGVLRGGKWVPADQEGGML